jgi:hypothetical protein
VPDSAPVPLPKPYKLTATTFDAFYGQFDHTSHSALRVDLREVGFISSSVMVQLAAVCHAHAGAGQPVTLLTQDNELRSYLSRAGFFRAIVPVATVYPPLPPAQAQWYAALAGDNPLLIEVTHLTEQDDLSAIVARVVLTLRRRLHYRRRDAFRVAQIVSEISHNMLDHTDHHDGFFAMQVHGRQERRFLELGVSDYGAGLLATLRRNPQYAGLRSAREALGHAIELGVSEFGHTETTRGTGLFHLVRIVRQHHGTVHLRSGDWKLLCTDTQAVQRHVIALPGVHICLQLPTNATP